MLSLHTFRVGLGYAFAGAALVLSTNALASSKDYRFELAGPPAKTATATVVEVRLIHVPDGKPVSGAEISEVKFDMGPGGMAGMIAPAKPASSTGSGVYVIETKPSMAGDWALTLTAKVKGEPDTIRGAVTVAVPK